ncbi:uncharacterized protein LOC105356520 isoform X2 [Oryzias latipes]
MDTWKIQLVVVTFCALVQTYQGLLSSAEQARGLSNEWQSESLDMRLNNPMEDLMKRSKALRFYGLMGKRSVTKKPFQFNRQSIIRETPSEASTEIHVAEKPYSKDLPEEWIQILY